MRFDVLIRGGQVLDGTGTPARRADIGLLGDRIEAVEDLSLAEAGVVVDAAGRCVCPGFIDVHSHSDAYLLIEPAAPSKVFQGVTTEVVGNCGASAAPRLGRYLMPSDWRAMPYPGSWRTVAEYRALLEQVKPAVNVVLLIGHNALRASVMGYEERRSTADELAEMKALLARCMDEGGAGWSTGLIYSPGMFAAPSEIVELARVVAGRKGIYTSHMRSEGGRLLEALDETIGVGRETGVRVQVSHLKTSGRANWGLREAALDRVRAARAEGLEVAADRYPYTASCTDLDVILPDWAAGGGREEVLTRLRDPATRARIREEIAARRDAAYWENLVIGSVRHPGNAGFKGRPIVEVARRLGLEPVDAALHLMDTDELHTSGIFFGMSEDNMWRILAEPYVMIGSDASLRAPSGPLSRDHPHPRAYGAFPRFLRASLDGRTVSPAEAVRKMTSLPARQFGLKDRGLIEPGMKADIVVFDAGGVGDAATYEEPHRLARGIETLMVNGQAVLSGGKPTNVRPGRFLSSRR
ncbi:MAG TPA: D-aminoacylase [Kiritimatiellia bacterium]|nr:D-aminoacylase [Kiritimatiellia bacterium]HRZ13544.1 D-aminoacylase [Kiritimatiellia bacterium]HSA19151.1 D-aminoacylase [Kiritimatiellia bacterium]